MSNKPQETEDPDEKPSVTLPGKVEKIIPGVVPAMPDKAQIAVEGGIISTKRFASKIRSKTRMASPYP
jgi:hypothetical protein